MMKAGAQTQLDEQPMKMQAPMCRLTQVRALSPYRITSCEVSSFSFDRQT